MGSELSVCAGRQNFIAPTVINTAGAWAEKIAVMIEDDIILGHKALMLMVTEHAAHFIKPVISVIGRPLSFKQTDQGTLVIGGSLQGRADLEAQKSFADFSVFAKSAQVVTDLFSSVASLHIVRTWAGIEAVTDDYLPVIGPSINALGVFHAFGCYKAMAFNWFL